MELSELLPGLGGVADDITLIRSMHTGVNNHGQSIYALNTGRIPAGRPALGSWLTYGLGTESQDLPAYCVLTDPGGLPVVGVDNWSSGWLPSLYQGTVIRPARAAHPQPRPAPAPPGAGPGTVSSATSTGSTATTSTEHPGEHDLEARIASYELAARMQTAAKEALDVSKESAATLPALRPRRPGDARVRHALPDRPAAGRARRAVRAGLHRQPGLGPPRRHPHGPAGHVPQGRQPLGRPGHAT